MLLVVRVLTLTPPLIVKVMVASAAQEALVVPNRLQHSDTVMTASIKLDTVAAVYVEGPSVMVNAYIGTSLAFDIHLSYFQLKWDAHTGALGPQVSVDAKTPVVH